MAPKGPPFDITNIETRDFFKDEDSQPMSNEAFIAKLGAPLVKMSNGSCRPIFARPGPTTQWPAARHGPVNDTACAIGSSGPREWAWPSAGRPIHNGRPSWVMGSLICSQDYQGQRKRESVGPNLFVNRDKVNINLFVSYEYAKFSTLLGINKWWSMDPPS